MKQGSIFQQRMPIIFAVWMWTMFAARLLTIDQEEGGNKYVLFLALSWPLLTFPLVPQAWKSFSFKALLSHRGFFLFLGVFVAGNVLSIFQSSDRFTSAANFTSLIVAFLLAYAMSESLDDHELTIGLQIFSVIGSVAMLVYGGLSHMGVQDRLAGDLNPNHVGFIAISVIIASLLHTKIPLVLLTMSPALLVLYLTNSRAAMISALIGVLFWLLFRTQKLPAIGLITYVAIIGTIVLIPLYFDEMGLKGLLIVASDLFALEDPRRGIGTGATGRWDAWKEAWQIFLDRPLLGVGYRMHGTHMKNATYAHNGYIALMAECGLAGTISFAYFVLKSLRRYSANLHQPIVAWSTGLLFAYFFNNCFEGYLFTIGHPTTLLALFLLVRGFSLSRHSGNTHPFRPRTSPSVAFWNKARFRINM